MGKPLTSHYLSLRSSDQCDILRRGCKRTRKKERTGTEENEEEEEDEDEEEQEAGEEE